MNYDFVISCIGNDDDLIEITTSENGCFKLS
jgi:3-hydroxyisobutyrate dehydrogenase-like beta-hydroxyacid dehydrogenase